MPLTRNNGINFQFFQKLGCGECEGNAFNIFYKNGGNELYIKCARCGNVIIDSRNQKTY